MKLIPTFTYICLQTTHPQASKKYPNRLSSDYPIIILTPTFSTKRNTDIITHSYKQTLEYTPQKNKPKTKTQNNITWFKPPYYKSVTSIIYWHFLNMNGKHFPNYRSLAKIPYRNNRKVSYSCTSNISQMIKSLQKMKTLHNNTHQNKQCNCKNKELCTPYEQTSNKKS